MNSENDMARGETIGRHLYNFAHMKNDPRAHDPAPDWEDAGSMTREMWRKLGRECLRQMEWARHQVGISGPTTVETTRFLNESDQRDSELRFGQPVTFIETIAHAKIHIPALSLAPPDWSPPECST